MRWNRDKLQQRTYDLDIKKKNLHSEYGHSVERVLRVWGISVLVKCSADTSPILNKDWDYRPWIPFPHTLVCDRKERQSNENLTYNCPCKALQGGFVWFVALVSSFVKTFSTFPSTGQYFSKATDWFQAVKLVGGGLCPHEGRGEYEQLGGLSKWLN